MKRAIRIFFGLVLLLASVPLWKQFVVFPIGLYTSVELIASNNGWGDISTLLGRLTGDFLLLVVCCGLLYFGVRPLRGKRPLRLDPSEASKIS